MLCSNKQVYAQKQLETFPMEMILLYPFVEMEQYGNNYP